MAERMDVHVCVCVCVSMCLLFLARALSRALRHIMSPNEAENIKS